jgi:hypothetical protein
MATKIPLHIQAAAEMELRRRQRERATTCCMCDLSEKIALVYTGTATRPQVCEHTVEQQDPNSAFNQHWNWQIKEIYGSSGEDLESEVAI